ncbi:MAG: hypothetical protein JWO62_2659 [Acidimicrobiaceae bacterium]|jgi:cell wall-associated NlpC family hydrolase|nr:hypothetical protein [Acidimicrobiaceae bacterium]
MWSVRFRCAVVATVASTIALVGVAAPAQATPVTSPSPSQVQSAKAEAAALETTIAADGQRAQVAGERYDQATVSLQHAKARLATVRAELAVYAGRIVVARARVRSAAVAAYVYGDSAAAQFGEVLSSNIVDASTITAYAGVATTHLKASVDQLAVDETRLRESEAAQAQAAARASSAVVAAASTRRAVDGATSATQVALGRVKGHIAQLIAQQEAAAAAAAEARARAAAAAAAQARASERAAALAKQQQAESQAAAAANVASAVAGSNPSNTTVQQAAAAATTSATSASSAGQLPLQPAGTNPAGLQAVRSAESYLGVPYVWGGANSRGVDCSGLTLLAWASAGVSLSHSAWYQYGESQHIPLSQIEPGDLVFYWFPNDGSDPVTHVAMYVGSGPYGAQTLIQAPETGETVSYVSMYYYGLVGVGRPGG